VFVILSAMAVVILSNRIAGENRKNSGRKSGEGAGNGTPVFWILIGFLEKNAFSEKLSSGDLPSVVPVGTFKLKCAGNQPLKKFGGRSYNWRQKPAPATI
jgi:hypothetical protein